MKFLLNFTDLNVFSQESSFYIHSLRSIYIDNKPSVLKTVSFNDVDVVYNKISQFINHKIVISTPGNYEISGFATINPGVMGSAIKDSIVMELLLIKNRSEERRVGKECRSRCVW